MGKNFLGKYPEPNFPEFIFFAIAYFQLLEVSQVGEKTFFGGGLFSDLGTF